MVQVLLLLRSSTHTHPAVPGSFFRIIHRELTKRLESYDSVFLESGIHGDVEQEVCGHSLLGPQEDEEE